MILLVDIGNTSTKVAKYCEGKITEPIRYSHGQAPWASFLNDITEVRISCVGPESELTSLNTECVARNIPTIVCTWDCSRVKQILPNLPKGLGADRVAAILGARVQCKDCPVFIVDAGTCLTTDFVTADGEHLGGIISPGLELRLRSMHEHTAGLPLISTEGEAPLWAMDTAQAMRGGAIRGMQFEIEGYVRAALERLPDTVIFYTGGNSLDIPSVVVHYDNSLVLKGLLAL